MPTNSADLNNNILLNETSGGVISTPKDTVTMVSDRRFDCTWKITAPPGHVVNLTFTAFGMKAKNFLCSDYFVAVYDALFGEASNTVIEKLCGQLSHIQSRIFSSGRYLSVYYKPGAGKSAQERGFQALYSFLRQSEYLVFIFYDMMVMLVMMMTIVMMMVVTIVMMSMTGDGGFYNDNNDDKVDDGCDDDI